MGNSSSGVDDFFQWSWSGVGAELERDFGIYGVELEWSSIEMEWSWDGVAVFLQLQHKSMSCHKKRTKRNF